MQPVRTVARRTAVPAFCRHVSFPFVWRILWSESEVEDGEDDRAARTAEVEDAQLHAVEIACEVERAELDSNGPRRDVERAELHADARAGKVDRPELDARHRVGHVVYEAKVRNGKILNLSVPKVDHASEDRVGRARQLDRRRYDRKAKRQPDPRVTAAATAARRLLASNGCEGARKNRSHKNKFLHIVSPSV